jgi:hypothetical protein
MPTPATQPHLMEVWEELEQYLGRTTKGPYVRRQVWRTIASLYGVGYETVRDWLRIGRPKWVLYHLHFYLQQVDFEKRLTLKEIADKAAPTYGKPLTEKQIARALKTYQIRFGSPLVIEVEPGHYKLNQDFYGYKNRDSRI